MTIWDEEPQAGLGDRWTRDAADWDAVLAERLVEAVGSDADDTGTALVAEARTGPAVPRLAAARPGLRRIMVVDPDRELLNIARETASDVTSPPLFFNGQGVQTLNFADDVFSVALCCGGVATEADALNALSELERVVAPGGLIALGALGAGSFPAISEILRECAWADERDDAIRELEDRLAIAATTDALVASAERLGLEVVATGTEAVDVLLERGDAVTDNALLDVEWWPAWGIVSADADAVREAFARRAAGWFGDDAIDDSVRLVWLVARVVEPEPVPVDEGDVVDAAPVAGITAGGMALDVDDAEVLSIDDADESVLSVDEIDGADIVYTSDVEVVAEVDADGENVHRVFTSNVEVVAEVESVDDDVEAGAADDTAAAADADAADDERR